MNGWKRIYAIFVLVVSIYFLGRAIADYPRDDWFVKAAAEQHCGIAIRDKEQAKELLRFIGTPAMMARAPNPQYCSDSLDDYVDGTTLAKVQHAHLTVVVPLSALALVVISALAYGAGLAIAWVRKGFREDTSSPGS